MGRIIWPICVVFVFGSWYFIRNYEQEKAQLFKVLCIFGLLASAFTLIVWGFALGMLAAGMIQSFYNLAQYKKNPEKFAEQLKLNDQYFNFTVLDILQLVLLMAILAVICIVAFRAMKSYYRVLKTGTSDQYSFMNMGKKFGLKKTPFVANKTKSSDSNKNTITDNTKPDNPKPLGTAVAFCPKCGARLPEGVSSCSGCGRKLKNK